MRSKKLEVVTNEAMAERLMALRKKVKKQEDRSRVLIARAVAAVAHSKAARSHAVVENRKAARVRHESIIMATGRLNGTGKRREVRAKQEASA